MTQTGAMDASDGVVRTDKLSAIECYSQLFTLSSCLAT